MGGTHPYIKKINSTWSCVPGCLNLATLLLYNPTLMKGNKMTKKEKEKLRQDLDLLKKEELIQILLDKEEKEESK